MLVLAEHDFTYVHMQLVGREQDMEAGAGWVRSSMCVKIALLTNRHIEQKIAQTIHDTNAETTRDRIFQPIKPTSIFSKLVIQKEMNTYLHKPPNLR